MIWCVLGIFFLATVGCIYGFLTCFYAANNKEEDIYRPHKGAQYIAVADEIAACTRKMDEVPFESVSVSSFDGLRLFGRYYHLCDGAPVMILFHGYRSMALRDSAGGFALARKMGMNVLAVDQRAHGKSGGHVITFGVKECRDCLSWTQYINQRFETKVPVILSGLSMGAATVVMATSLPLPDNVSCVLADCPYSSPGGIIRKVGRDLHIPDKITYPFVWLAARIFGGFSLNAVTALHAAKVSNIPILLLHGEDDRFVPCEMSHEIHTGSNGCTQLVTFPDAGHGLSYTVDPRRYEESVYTFLSQIPALADHLQGVRI